MTKEEFLSDVRHEIEMLKQHATEEEIWRLNINTFSPTSINSCIYGQMTGSCQTFRAKELMDLACNRVMSLESGVEDIKSKHLEDIVEGYVNGEYTGQTWGEKFRVSNYFHRSWQYLSALEGYINARDANNAGMIAYLKGETNTLIL